MTQALLLPVLLIGFITATVSPASATAPVGYLTSVSDFEVVGCGYDPDSPDVKIQVHVYSEATIGMIGIADRACPGWGNNRGFRIQYRRPLNVTANVNVALIGTVFGDVTWLSTAGVPQSNLYDRASQTLLIGVPNKYQIGISKKYGAAATEYYNRRVDGTLNLVTTSIGAAFQTALFGNSEVPRDGYSANCLGLTNPPYGDAFIWNPTQAGGFCPQNGSSPFVTSPILWCQSSIPGGCSGTNIEIQTPGWVKFGVRWRNFHYPPDPSGSFPYRWYDDVWGEVTYSLFDEHVQVDWRMWRDGAAAGAQNPPQTFGPNWQFLPVFFPLQATEYQYKKDGTIRTLVRSLAGQANDTYSIGGGNDGRWVTMKSVNNDPNRPVMAPGDHFTVAFYNKAHAGTCRTNEFSLNLGPMAGVDTYEHNGAIASRLWFEPVFPNPIEAQAVLFPYLHTDVLPGKADSLGTLLDRTSGGGYMPSWACNPPQ